MSTSPTTPHGPSSRREALRFRRGMDEAAARAGALGAEAAALRARLAAVEAEAGGADAFLRRRCGMAG